jgi:hypothetical protein
LDQGDIDASCIEQRRAARPVETRPVVQVLKKMIFNNKSICRPRGASVAKLRRTLVPGDRSARIGDDKVIRRFSVL